MKSIYRYISLILGLMILSFNAGADAIEINAAVLPIDPSRTSESIEQTYYGLVESLNEELTIPYGIKVGPYFTSMRKRALPSGSFAGSGSQFTMNP